MKENPDPPQNSTCVDCFCILVARLEDGAPCSVYVSTGATWDEADAKVHAQIERTFLEEQAVAIINIYRVTNQGIEWFDYREDPEDMRIYRQIRMECRKHLPPGSYHLSLLEKGKCTLGVSLRKLSLAAK